MFHNGKPKTGTTLLPRAAFIYTIEPLEQSVQLFLFHTTSIIFETNTIFRIIMPKNDQSAFNNSRSEEEYGIAERIIARSPFVAE